MTRKRTKIIATLGPSTDNIDVLDAMLEAGLDMVRLNFSHGVAADHEKRLKVIREKEIQFNRQIGILADLQGPKIRISRFREGKVFLKEGETFIFDANLDGQSGDETRVGIDYKALPQDVKDNDMLLVDDGRLVFQVTRVIGAEIHTRVQVGGELSNNKGINRLGGGLSAKALTDKDKEDLKTATNMGVDYIAISFPRDAADVEEARALVKAEGSSAGIIAKIERVEAVKAIDEIIMASDAVMVARGDLGVEMGDAELPFLQKEIIHKCRNMEKAVITATQMMESMIHNAIPTRAEVLDVANAVLDGTDAVMLSAETATGDHPHKVVEAMARICQGAERHPRMKTSRHRMEHQFRKVDEAIAMAAMYTANHLNIKAIICLTESGSTPLLMSRIRSGIPIYALSRHVTSLRKMTLYRGVYPLHFDVTRVKHEEINEKTIECLVNLGLVSQGDNVILTKGTRVGIHGGTNAMKILKV